MRISVIMPTYNDAESISKSITSLFNQSHQKWELIIVDDGSTDHTKEVVEQILNSHPNHSKKVKYLYQENQDQLAAITHGLSYASGEYIYILHSDDEIPEFDTFEKLVALIELDSTYDAYIGDWETMDEHGQVTGIKKVMEYEESSHRLALLYLWLGRNLYVDVGLFKASTFKESIKASYLTWNMPFWIDFDQGLRLLRVKNTDFLMYRYRVFSGNYIHSDLGQLNVINGELRTLTSIMKSISIPFYKVQYILYRALNKLGAGKYYKPYFQKTPEKNRGQIVEFVVNKRFGLTYKSNAFLRSIVSYYHFDKEHILSLDKIPADCPIYTGKDMRRFNRELLRGNLHNFYMSFMKEMETGFSEIRCFHDDYDAVQTICKFMCISPIVTLK